MQGKSNIKFSTKQMKPGIWIFFSKRRKKFYYTSLSNELRYFMQLYISHAINTQVQYLHTVLKSCTRNSFRSHILNIQYTQKGTQALSWTGTCDLFLRTEIWFVVRKYYQNAWLFKLKAFCNMLNMFVTSEAYTQVGIINFLLCAFSALKWNRII